MGAPDAGLPEEETDLFVAFNNNFADDDTYIIGMFRSKKSAAEAIFECFIDSIHPDFTTDESGIRRFSTKERTFTKSEFIRHLVNGEYLLVCPDFTYDIIWYDERKIEP